MLKKRVRKEFPEGTFIPTPARVFAILQLTLALLVLLWHTSQPFMGDLFNIRSHLAVYEYVMGVSSPSGTKNLNKERFEALPLETQEAVQKGQAFWQTKKETNFWKKLEKSVASIYYMPLFEKIWLLFSLILPVFILIKRPGAIQAAWLIPLVIFFYAVDHRWNVKPAIPSDEQKLFPSEHYLLTTYASSAPLETFFDQKQALKAALENYLIYEWAKETPSQEPEMLLRQIDEGQYLFTLARALAKKLEFERSIPTQKPTGLLLIYLLWNIAFAYTVTKYRFEPIR